MNLKVGNKGDWMWDFALIIISIAVCFKSLVWPCRVPIFIVNIIIENWSYERKRKRKNINWRMMMLTSSRKMMIAMTADPKLSKSLSILRRVRLRPKAYVFGVSLGRV